jgi:predicted permease
MDSVLGDLRYAIRNIVRRPGFSALAVLTLAVGIGINTVAFTAVNALLFHPFVFKGVERLGWIMLATPGNPHGELSFPEFAELKRSATAFDELAVEGRMPLPLMADGRAEQIWTLLVSDGYFRALGTAPATGRLLEPGDTTRDDLVAVVSHDFWTGRLNGASIAGQTLTIANRTVSIVGVLPNHFQGPGGLFAPDVWLPLERADALAVPRRHLTGDDRWLTAIGRLRTQATAAQARAELTSIGAHLPLPAVADDAGKPAADRSNPRDRRLGFFPMREGHPEVRGLAPFVWIAMAVVGLVLLIACFNVAALMFARAAERRREIGIRTALGAGRLRIVRQLITEGLLLAAVSGGLSLALAAWSGRLLAAFSLPAPIPQRLNLQVDARIVLFTSAMVLVAGVLPGLLPALAATRRNLVSSMRLGGAAEGRPSRAGRLFVGVQIAGSTLFLATALLFVRSFWNANAVDIGFKSDGLVVAQLQPALYGFEGGRAEGLAAQLADRVAATPDVLVAVADRVPYAVGYPRAETVSTSTLDCAASPCKPVVFYAVGARHFDVLGLPLRGGRDFTKQELQAGGAVIVNQALAARLWPGQSPIGQDVMLGTARTHATVVGVAADTSLGYTGQPATPVFYRPIRQEDFATGFSLLARTSGREALAGNAIRDAVHSVAPGMPIAAVSSMNEMLALPMWPRRTAAGFFLICGALALVLATVGLFGVTYFTVRQRTREFGIRIALGARGADVVRQVLREGARLACPAAAAGLLLAYVAGRLLARGLLGVSAADPASFSATAAIEIAVALLACGLPARRATQSDPMLALRDDN